MKKALLYALLILILASCDNPFFLYPGREIDPELLGTWVYTDESADSINLEIVQITESHFYRAGYTNGEKGYSHRYIYSVVYASPEYAD